MISSCTDALVPLKAGDAGRYIAACEAGRRVEEDIPHVSIPAAVAAPHQKRLKQRITREGTRLGDRAARTLVAIIPRVKVGDSSGPRIVDIHMSPFIRQLHVALQPSTSALPRMSVLTALGCVLASRYCRSCCSGLNGGRLERSGHPARVPGGSRFTQSECRTTIFPDQKMPTGTAPGNSESRSPMSACSAPLRSL